MAETLLTVDRTDHPAHTPEAEPLLVVHDGDDIVLRLDDGVELRADRTELLAALLRAASRVRVKDRHRAAA